MPPGALAWSFRVQEPPSRWTLPVESALAGGHRTLPFRYILRIVAGQFHIGNPPHPPVRVSVRLRRSGIHVYDRSKIGISLVDPVSHRSKMFR